MKKAQQWVDEYSQSGAFDIVDNCAHAERIVEAIQADAIASVRDRIKRMIKPGPLEGSGRDLHAQRNGIVLTLCAIDEMVSQL